MPLIRLDSVTLAFSEVPILDKINLLIEAREKIFLVGRNGMGKSCLFKVLMGRMKPDDGKVFLDPGVKVAELEQELPSDDQLTVYDFVAQGLAAAGILLKRYHKLINTVPEDTDQWMREIETVQHELEANNGWQLQQTIDSVLTKLELPADKLLGQLSGGWKRRAALARALVSQPDLLLLDEPTNHLDLAAIEWLEQYLAEYNGALLCITHDRALLRKISQRIIELDRGNIFSYNGNFDRFLEDKSHRLEVESQQAKLFDKVLAKEEAWIRQGVKARRTRNEGRVRALEQLRRERSLRRNLQGNPQFGANQQSSSGDLVVDAEHLNYAINDLVLVKDFSTRIYKGDKIALIGPNGVGKTTLLNLLLGNLKLQSGKLKLGTNLHIGYFDQLRAGLDYEKSAIDNVAGGRDTINVNGKDKHIISYLADFLFTPERMRIPVRMLSGGECNRLLLAKMFSLPSNLLVLDEPTNDLDIESLELLEEILGDYAGTILLVSHDREFVDKVATSTFCFRGNGIIEENVGGFKDIPVKTASSSPPKAKPSQTKTQATPEPKPEHKKELHDLTKNISKLEAQRADLLLKIGANEFYNGAPDVVKKTLDQLAKIDQNLEDLYARWEQLESQSLG